MCDNELYHRSQMSIYM